MVDLVQTTSGVTLGIALRCVDVHKHVESVHEDMPRPHTRIKESGIHIRRHIALVVLMAFFYTKAFYAFGALLRSR